MVAPSYSLMFLVYIFAVSGRRTPKAHNTDSMGKAKPTFTCSKCGTHFTRKYSLQRHQVDRCPVQHGRIHRVARKRTDARRPSTGGQTVIAPTWFSTQKDLNATRFTYQLRHAQGATRGGRDFGMDQNSFFHDNPARDYFFPAVWSTNYLFQFSSCMVNTLFISLYLFQMGSATNYLFYLLPAFNYLFQKYPCPPPEY